MRAAFAVILTLILPGAGHLVVRRYLRGAVLAVLFAVSADICLYVAYLVPFGGQTPLFSVAISVASGVWVFSIVDIAIRLKSRRAKDFRTKNDEFLRAAQVAWLRDDLPEAERLLGAILRRDERDIEAWVHLGKILKSVGRQAEARACFRSALNLDGSEAWRYMLRAELSGANSGEDKSAATA